MCKRISARCEIEAPNCLAFFLLFDPVRIQITIMESMGFSWVALEDSSIRCSFMFHSGVLHLLLHSHGGGFIVSVTGNRCAALVCNSYFLEPKWAVSSMMLIIDEIPIDPQASDCLRICCSRHCFHRLDLSQVSTGNGLLTEAMLAGL